MVQLIVNNEALDLSEKPIMTFQAQDISDIESRQGDFSYEFEVPATQKNKRLLKRSHYIYGAPYQMIEAWFRAGSDVKKGFIQVAEFEDVFTVNFFSGNSNWIALIGDKMLSDLNLSRFDHIYDRSTVVASFTNTEGYIYPYMMVHSGVNRAAYAGTVSPVNTGGIPMWMEWTDLSGPFFNEGLFASPFYTLDHDYTLSIYLRLEVTTFTGGAGTLGIYKRLPGGYVGLETASVTGTGTYDFRYTGDFKEGDAIGSYLLKLGDNFEVGVNSFIRFTTALVDLENIDFLELYPAVYVHSLIKQIFQEIQFKLSGPFLNNADYRRMTIPFSGTQFVYTDPIVIFKSIYLGLDGDQQLDDPEEVVAWDGFDPPYYFDPIYYSSPRYYADGNYNINIEVRFVVTDSGATTSDINIRKNGINIFSETLVSNDQTWNVDNVVMAAGDYIEVWVATGDYLTLGIGSYFKVTCRNDILEGGDVFVSGLLPEMKQIDLIKYVFISFGIVPQVEEFSKTLNLSEFRNIRNNTPENWTEKLISDYRLNFYDFSASFYKLNNFKYKEYDEDIRLKDYLSANNQAYGDGRIQLDNVFITGEGDIFQSEFVPAFFRRHNRLGEWAHAVTFARDKFPRILFVVPDALIADFASFAEINIKDEVYPFTNIAWAYFTKYQLGTDLDNFKTNLAYTMPEILNPNGFGLLSKYWDDYAGIMNRPKMLVAQFKLTLKDLLTLDYTRRKYISGENITGYYYLNSIRSYDLDTGIAECELVLLDNLDIIEEEVLITEESLLDAILQENTDYILQENTDNILQE